MKNLSDRLKVFVVALTQAKLPGNTIMKRNFYNIEKRRLSKAPAHHLRGITKEGPFR